MNSLLVVVYGTEPLITFHCI